MPEILLIDPPLDLEVSYGPLERIGSTLPSLGLLTLAACLREKGVEVEVIHATPEGLGAEQLVKRVLASGARMVGFRSIACTVHIIAAICRQLKKQKPEITTIIGGPHVTAVPEETFLLFPELDVGVVGEGEISLYNLIEALRSGGPLDQVQGLVFRDEAGQIVTTGHSPYVRDLDSLPFPAFDLLPRFPERYHPSVLMYKHLPSINIVAGRGCTGKCIYCDRNVFGNRLRNNSPEYTFKLMQHLNQTYGIVDFVFYDDNFVLRRQFITELCNLMIAQGAPFSWSGMARIDFLDQDLLRLMRRAGCWQIAYGIESGNAEVLQVLKKGYQPELVSRVLDWTHEAGINAKGYFMMGNPGETLETIRETVDFACRSRLYDFEISKCCPLPNTELANRLEEFGRQDGDWSQMTNLNPVFIPHGLDAETLEREYKLAVRRFYLRPKILWAYGKRIFTDPGMLRRMFLLVWAFTQLQLTPAKGASKTGPTC
jgi:radical SAM superfamily enzyme YgiQ (UPF0313 family)